MLAHYDDNDSGLMELDEFANLCYRLGYRPETRGDGRGRAEGFSMCWIDSGMLVATTCTLGTFFSPMCAASQILPSGPFLASTYWE